MSLTKVTYSMIQGASVNLLDYGAVGNGSANDTAAINAAYAAAAAQKVALILPAGTFLFNSQLLWNKNVSVFGQREFTVLLKDGNFDGIKLTSSAAGCTFDGFVVKGNTANGGRGVVVNSCSYLNVKNLDIRDHASDGFYIDSTAGTGGTYFSRFENLLIVNNGGDGFAINGTGATGGGVCNTCVFDNVICTGNTGIGFHQYGVASLGYHYGGNIVCQNNTGGGMLLEGIASNLSTYLESNTGFDLKLSSTSLRNVITLVNETILLKDQGTNNTIIGGAFSGIQTNQITAPVKVTSSGTGRDLYVIGGTASNATSGIVGGSLVLLGGDAGGTTSAANGGDVYIGGGAGNAVDPTAVLGNVKIASAGGQLVVGSTAQGNESTLVRFASTTRAVTFVGISTAQIAALTAVKGMVAYNSSTDKLQVYNGSWVDLH